MVEEHGLKGERGNPQCADSAAQVNLEMFDFSSGNSPERREEKSSRKGWRFCGEQVYNEESTSRPRCF